MQEPIRILHLLTSIIPNGGVQSLVLAYAAKTASYGVVFDYIAQGPGDPALERRCREAGSRIFPVPEMTHHPFAFIRAIYRLLKEHPEYRAFHAHQNFINFIPLMAAKAADVPVRISHSHAGYPTVGLKKAIRRAARRLILDNATEYWACSAPSYEWLYGQPYTETAHSYILHNAIDVERFAYREDRRRTLREANGLTDEFICICVGTLSPLKNQRFLLDVMRHIQLRRPQRTILLWLVGNGPIRPELEDACREMDLTDSVRFWGIRGDVPDLLLQADCMVMPSFAEGLPVSAVEAQVSGLPCVLSANIPREVAFRKDVSFPEIGTENIGIWAEQILQFSETHVDRTEPLPPGFSYDIDQEAQKIAQKYRSLLGSMAS